MITNTKKKVLALFAEGRQLYKQRLFSEAVECFVKALELDKEDGPSRVYRDRCLLYQNNPPPPEWNGVFIMTSK